MLVLSRKVGEKLIIGDNITVVVNRVAGNRVTIGIDAPGDVRIIRGELKPTIDEFQHEPPRAPQPALALPAVAEPALAESTLAWTSGGYDRAADTVAASVPRLAK
jgi:carbon storage regulator